MLDKSLARAWEEDCPSKAPVSLASPPVRGTMVFKWEYYKMGDYLYLQKSCPLSFLRAGVGCGLERESNPASAHSTAWAFWAFSVLSASSHLSHRPDVGEGAGGLQGANPTQRFCLVGWGRYEVTVAC